MARDGRGTPGRIILKNQPRLTLAALLRRRRTTLKAFIAELGVSTYTALDIWCGRTGVVPPTLAEFEACVPPTQKVNSPQEGVIVLEAPPVLDEISGRPIDPEAPTEPGVEVLTQSRNALVQLNDGPDETLEGTQKKRRQKKESQPTET